MSDPNGRSQIERPSPLTFDQTLQRLSTAIADAGMQLFAVIDHAENARQVGLSMPPATVFIYGKAEGGTPVMLAAPQSALDLPLRVLVREDVLSQVFVSFYPIRRVLESLGVVPDLAVRLEPAQELLLQAIAP